MSYRFPNGDDDRYGRPRIGSTAGGKPAEAAAILPPADPSADELLTLAARLRYSVQVRQAAAVMERARYVTLLESAIMAMAARYADANRQYHEADSLKAIRRAGRARNRRREALFRLTHALGQLAMFPGVATPSAPRDIQQF